MAVVPLVVSVCMYLPLPLVWSLIGPVPPVGVAPVSAFHQNVAVALRSQQGSMSPAWKCVDVTQLAPSKFSVQGAVREVQGVVKVTGPTQRELVPLPQLSRT